MGDDRAWGNTMDSRIRSKRTLSENKSTTLVEEISCHRDLAPVPSDRSILKAEELNEKPEGRWMG